MEERMIITIRTRTQEIALKHACMSEDQYSWQAMIIISNLAKEHHRKIVRAVWHNYYTAGIWRLQEGLAVECCRP
jgi:hypothetical protein